MTPECIFKPSIFLSALQYYIQLLNCCLLFGTFRVQQNTNEFTFPLGLFTFCWCHWKTAWSIQLFELESRMSFLSSSFPSPRTAPCPVPHSLWSPVTCPPQPQPQHCPQATLPCLSSAPKLWDSSISRVIPRNTLQAGFQPLPSFPPSHPHNVTQIIFLKHKLSILTPI